MKRYPLLVSTLAVFWFVACSPKPDYKVSGAQWLESESDGGMYDVLAYPLDEDELAYFETNMATLEAGAASKPELWESIAVADDPVWAASQTRFWQGTGLNGEDVIAVSLKLTFLWEFASSDEPIKEEIRESLQFLEERMQSGDASPELLATANSMQALLTVIEAHEEAGAFTFYAENKERVDAALDRFTSIGEQ